MGFQVSLGDGDCGWGISRDRIGIGFSRRAAAALGLRRVCERTRADVVRYEGGVLAEPISLDDNGVVKQAIK